MPTALRSDARNMILKVLVFMKEEKLLQAQIIPFDKLYERITATTGVGKHFVRKLVKEKEDADAAGTKIFIPGKKRLRLRVKIEIDEFDLGVIRRKIHDFYAMKKEIRSNQKLLLVLREEIDFKGSRETLRNILSKIGF
ncbi:unnamed protein product [Pieris brassicae]|uniref:Uncharacterized protein n=1 Tax=Pieris brassicae TaxID=7116 RepID=A0A9P0SXQ5_PIEBR|nr:unnamed protein product [Pieris brassicae]